MFKILKSILFAIVLMILAIPKANAVIEVEEYMGDNYLPHQGYSTEMIRLVKISRAKTFGQPVPTYWPKTPFKRAVRKFYAYLDPAVEIGDFGHHDTLMDPSPWDY